MRTRELFLLPLLVATLAGCGIDFVGPEVLRFQRAPNASFSLDVSDVPSCAVDGGFLPPPGQQLVTLCVNASIFPGITVLGEQLGFESDTLWVNEHPLVGTEAPNGTMVFSGGIRLPLASLAATEIRIRYPRMEAVATAPELRWYFAGRVQPDTVRRAPGEPVRLELLPPLGVSNPQASLRQWDVRVSGQQGTSALFGAGVPRPAYEFAPVSLEQVGGNSLTASYTWTQQFFGALGGVQTNVYAVQRLRWAVVTTAP
jgi:hypothetical protein